MIETESLTQAEEKKIHTPEQEWSDDFAYKVVAADYHSAMDYRRQHEARWQLADQLYFGWTQQKTWEGTKIPRSCLPMFVVLQQVESFLPRVMSAVFADHPWFEAGPQPGTTAMDAIAVRDVMLHQMELHRRLQNQSIREVFRRCIKSGLLYGNGILELNWLDIFKRRKLLSREPVAVRTPFMGQMVATGEMRQEVMERSVETRYQMPGFSYVSLRDFFIDPNCPGPQVQQARFAGTRAYLTADQLKGMRGQEGFQIPNDEMLRAMATQRPSRYADTVKANVDSVRGISWQPEMDASLDPGAARIEVVTYWTADRSVWVANPSDSMNAVLFNQPNDYGFIPLFDAFYIDALDRFFGLSMSDITEGEHRLQEAITNARIDELALTIHAARIKKRGSSIPAYQLRRRPGQVMEVESPKDDIVTETTQNITQQAFIETNASEVRVSKITGLNEAMSGTPAPGGNSANRTAAGIHSQVAAGSARVIYLVENIEDSFIEPVLSAFHQLNTMYLDPNEVIKMAGQDVDPLRIMNAEVLFTMKASAKMQSRAALLETFPLISQTFMNPELQAQLQRMGLTLDWQEMVTMLFDMTGYKTKGQLIRPLSEEEQQALQMAQESEDDPELTKQRERMASLAEMQEAKADAELQKTITKTAIETALEPGEEEADETAG